MIHPRQIAAAALLFSFACLTAVTPAWPSEIPKKIGREAARELAAEGYDHHTLANQYEDVIGDVGPPFFVFQGVGLGNSFAVNPWTGDVWSLFGCKRLSTPALRKSQMEIRSRFTPDELKEYPRLHRLDPGCWR